MSCWLNRRSQLMRCFLTSPSASRTRPACADRARHESAFHFERLLVDLTPSPQAWDFWQEVLSLSSSRTARRGAPRRGTGPAGAPVRATRRNHSAHRRPRRGTGRCSPRPTPAVLCDSPRPAALSGIGRHRPDPGPQSHPLFPVVGPSRRPKYQFVVRNSGTGKRIIFFTCWLIFPLLGRIVLRGTRPSIGPEQRSAPHAATRRRDQKSPAAGGRQRGV